MCTFCRSTVDVWYTLPSGRGDVCKVCAVKRYPR